MWVEGTLRLEYGKSGIYNSNRLPAEKKKKKKKKEKKENTRDRSVPDGSDNQALRMKIAYWSEEKKEEETPGIGRYLMGPTIIRPNHIQPPTQVSG